MLTRKSGISKQRAQLNGKNETLDRSKELPKRGNRLTHASISKVNWEKKYHDKIYNDVVWHLCPICNIHGDKAHMDPHHTHGRIGENILKYVWVHRQCHRWIHDNKKEAIKRGLIASNYD